MLKEQYKVLACSTDIKLPKFVKADSTYNFDSDGIAKSIARKNGWRFNNYHHTASTNRGSFFYTVNFSKRSSGPFRYVNVYCLVEIWPRTFNEKTKLYDIANSVGERNG